MAMKTRNLISATTAIAALAALLGYAFAPRAVPVELATATIGRFETTIDEDARTRVHDRFLISAPLTGQLARIALREGDRVEVGAVLATMTPTLSPLLDARSMGELAARVDSADAMVARARARIASARVVLQLAQTELASSEKLALQGHVAATKLEADRLGVLAAQRELDAAGEERHVAEHELEQARAASAAVRKPDDGSAPEFTLTAPIAGHVLKIHQTSAVSVAIGTPLLELGNLDTLEVVAELLTTDAMQAAPGSAVRIDGFGRDGVLEGHVRRVESAAFTKVSALGVEEQRVNVLIDIDSPREQWVGLGDGFRVSVHIVTLARDPVLRAPVSAVFPRSGDAMDVEMGAFVVRDGRARLVAVSVGARNGAEAWIESGLSAGDALIVYPGDAVRDGVRVEPRTVAAAAR